jgi:hypothetical protein
MLPLLIVGLMLAFARDAGAQSEDKKPASNEPASPQEPEEKQSPLQRLGITVTLFSLFENNTVQPELEYQRYKNVIDIVGHRGNWSYGGQLRSLIFSDRTRVLPDDAEKTAKFTIYRRFLQYTGANLSFRAGDFNQSLGYGITLFLQQDQTLRLDHTIDGGRVGLRWGRVEALVLGGVIDQATDDRGAIDFQRAFTDNQDKLIGTRIVGHLPRRATIGVNLTQFDYEARDSDRQQMSSLEFRAPGLLNRLDVAGEVAVTRRNPVANAPGTVAEQGRAIYLAVTGYVLGGTALAEYKNYRDMESPYSNLPNLGRTDDIIPNANVRGFRLRVDRTFLRTGTTAFVSYTQQNAVESKAPFAFPQPNFTTLLFGGLEQSLQDDRWYIRAIVGKRYEKDVGLTQTRATIDVNRRFRQRHSLGLIYDGRYTDLFLVREKDERFVFSYGLSPYVVFSVLTAQQKNTLKETGEVPLKENFAGAEVVFTPISAWFVKIFVGRLPGGLICSGGICRQENPFRGFRGSVSYRF